jgi:hypothetical protein
MSACIRSLYSSDQCAPVLSLVAFCGRGVGAVLLSLGDLRASTFSLSVTRGDLAFKDEFELFMQLLGTYWGLLLC